MFCRHRRYTITGDYILYTWDVQYITGDNVLYTQEVHYNTGQCSVYTGGTLSQGAIFCIHWMYTIAGDNVL